MNFFDLGSFSEHKVSLEHYKEWANEIASSYLRAGADPTTTLTKIASVEELQPHQVEALAAEANKAIHQAKYAKATDKYHAADFPLADARRAISQLQLDSGEEKVAVELPDPVCKDNNPDPFQMFGVKPETMDKTASVRHELKTASQKVALVKQKTADALILGKYAADATEKKFIKQARQLVLEGNNSAARMKIIGNIHHFAKCAELDNAARPALAKLAHVLGGEGMLEPSHVKKAVNFFLSKEADEKAPQELISEFLQARVANGSHPLYITLKTFNDQCAALNLNTERAQVIDDRNRILQQKIRAL